MIQKLLAAHLTGVEYSAPPCRAEQSFHRRTASTPHPTEFETLETFKGVMRVAARELATLPSCREAGSLEEKLFAVPGFLNAAECNDKRRQIKHAKLYPYVLHHVILDSPDVLGSGGLFNSRDHAIELSREDAVFRTAELRSLREPACV